MSETHYEPFEWKNIRIPPLLTARSTLRSLLTRILFNYSFRQCCDREVEFSHFHKFINSRKALRESINRIFTLYFKIETELERKHDGSTPLFDFHAPTGGIENWWRMNQSNDWIALNVEIHYFLTIMVSNNLRNSKILSWSKTSHFTIAGTFKSVHLHLSKAQ